MLEMSSANASAETLAPLTNSTFNNSEIQICPLVLAENQCGILSRRRFETDAASRHPCGI